MDDIIDKLKKKKETSSMDPSPLKQFFVQNEDDEAVAESETEEPELDIKQLGKKSTDIPVEKKAETVTEEVKENIPTSGIREFSFDELEKSPVSKTPNEPIKENGTTFIEIRSHNSQKIKHVKLIVALLEADQYDIAHQEIDKLKNSLEE